MTQPQPEQIREMLVAWCAANRGGMVVLERHSDDWERWRTWRQSVGLGVSFMDSREKWTVPAKHPPLDLSDLEDMARPVSSKAYKRLPETKKLPGPSDD